MVRGVGIRLAQEYTVYGGYSTINIISIINRFRITIRIDIRYRIIIIIII